VIRAAQWAKKIQFENWLFIIAVANHHQFSLEMGKLVERASLHLTRIFKPIRDATSSTGAACL
jgi:hypothetical protein